MDQARLGVQQLDRQIRSGNLIYNPAAENDSANGIQPGLSLRVYTQSNSVQRCVQWRIYNKLLQTRSWTTTWQVDDIVTAWRTVADHIVNTRPPRRSRWTRRRASGAGCSTSRCW